MAYLAKSTVLKAYQLLSDIDSDKRQGLTQKVSALKYASALDIYFKMHHQNCDLKQSSNKDLFASYVGEIVKINDEYCTKDFFLSVSPNGRDYDCGSNFFSQTSVKDSKTNSYKTFLYPKRSGWQPIMDIQNQELIYRSDYLLDIFSFYLGSSELRLAFIVWLLRFAEIAEDNMDGIKSALNNLFTNEYCDALYTDAVNLSDTSYIEFDEKMCELTPDDIQSLFNAHEELSCEKTTLTDFPLQTIFYGAPGTGKSYKVNELTKGDDTVIRTTFHPDSDYASFVGCYKPIEKEETRTFVHWDTGNQEPVLLKVSNKTGIPELDKEKKITYQFTQQAFLKAYIQAWKKLCKNNHSAAASSITTVVPPVGSVSLSFPVKSITYTIIEVTTNSIRVKREFDLIKNSVKNVWESLWTSGDFIIPRGSQSGRSVQIAVCRWIYENLDDSTKDSFDDGWTLLIDTLNSGEVYVSVADSKSSQVYTVTKIEDNDASVHISNVASSKRERLKECFEGTKPDGVEIGLIDVLKRINSENFDDAWEGLTEKIKKEENEYSDIQDVELIENKEDDGLITDPQYLVIEEINRGNCAQIFGDIFQLLDRNEAGFSTYPIVPDADITRELKKVFDSLDLSSVENVINGIFSENYPNGIVDKIKNGELLVLPCNLNLLATMNTSDQSLFPMDSAFKRRWDWEFVPIRYSKDEARDEKDNFHTFEIEIGDKKYKWTDFLQKVNAKILSVTDSEDKQMGEYFIKKSVDQKTFINKVMYYLWSEVGKDLYGSTNPFFVQKTKYENGQDVENQFSFNDLFKGNATQLLQGFMEKLEVKIEEEKAATEAGEE